MERWEDQIDVDDSDLHSFFHLHSQPSFPTSPQTLPRSLHPCSQNRPSSQTLDSNPPSPTHSQLPIALSQTNRIEKDLKNASTSRPPIPGPAGAIQAAMRRQSAIGAAECSPLAEGVSHGRYLCETEDLDFELNPWICALSSLAEWRGISGKDSGSCLSHPISSISASRSRGAERIPQVVGIVTDCKQNGLGDLFITLKDPTGTIGASVHRKVLSEGFVGREISVGCVLILNQVVAFCPARFHCYLNITLKNLVKLFEKDCGPPMKQIAPFTVVHGAEKNVKQLRMELPVGDQPLRVKKTSYAEPRGNFIGERTENCRKTFLPESANTVVKSDTRMNEPKRLISGASVGEWTDEQLEKLFSEYDDDF
ncbi:hypothetical protein KSP40_PGU017314 [Platanthera guangdongensis]|uniref:Homologous recombination OB-fold protein OB-fold domain-containing protein n=1 Tax=Platanthera guangdongensis TaxID=2320717 RepID=A0ABR2MN23_9ASPA